MGDLQQSAGCRAGTGLRTQVFGSLHRTEGDEGMTNLTRGFLASKGWIQLDNVIPWLWVPDWCLSLALVGYQEEEEAEGLQEEASGNIPEGNLIQTAGTNVQPTQSVKVLEGQGGQHVWSFSMVTPNNYHQLGS